MEKNDNIQFSYSLPAATRSLKAFCYGLMKFVTDCMIYSFDCDLSEMRCDIPVGDVDSVRLKSTVSLSILVG